MRKIFYTAISRIEYRLFSSVVRTNTARTTVHRSEYGNIGLQYIEANTATFCHSRSGELIAAKSE